jgi:thiamine biosynthesis lipoprotein
MQATAVKFSKKYWIVVVGSLLIFGCGLYRLQQRPQTLDLSGVAFNSMAWHARIADQPKDLSEQQIQQGLELVLEGVDHALSSWRADSEVAQFNRLSVNAPFNVTALFYHALLKAKQVSQQTHGAYDVTVSPLIDLWGFGPQGRPAKIPSDAQLFNILENIGWQHILLMPASTLNQYTVGKDKPVTINLSSLGEGSGVDAMRAWLEAHGIKNYMVSVAGTVIASGRNHHQPWQIAIEKPDASHGIQTILALSDVVVSTSGAYRNYYEVNGTHYSHTIDPTTGKPISHHTVSVTLIQPLNQDRYQGTYVDAMTTGLNVFGADKGLKFAHQQQQPLAVYYIEKINHQLIEKTSPAFKLYAAAR